MSVPTTYLSEKIEMLNRQLQRLELEGLHKQPQQETLRMIEGLARRVGDEAVLWQRVGTRPPEMEVTS